MTDAFSLHDKTILVTGASSGIGYATALQCAAAGARLIVVGRHEQKLDQLLQQLNRPVHQKLIADLTVPEQLQDLVAQSGMLDGVVHSAGIVEPFPVQFISRKKIEQTFSINYYAPVELTAQLLKQKKINKGGSLVFISSIAGQNPFKGGTSYSGSKAALEAFCRTVAVEYASKAIRANCLAPAMVKTRIFDAMAQNVEKETVEEHLRKYPLGVGTPKDVAHAVVFLLAPASRWITGVTIRMDGGLLLES